MQQRIGGGLTRSGAPCLKALPDYGDAGIYREGTASVSTMAASLPSRMPRVADSPKGWRHFSPAQKIEHLIGLDRCHEILSWSPTGLDPLRRSFQRQVMLVLLPIGIKAALDGSLDRDAAYENNRAAVLEELARDLIPS